MNNVEENILDDSDHIIIYADGACRNNQSKDNLGAIGIILKYKDQYKEIKEAFPNVTNNKMEILACIRGLQLLKTVELPVDIYTDSQYVVNTMTKGWSRNCNQDLWNELDLLCSQIKSGVQFIKIKGHSNDLLNIRADKLCNEAMDQYQKEDKNGNT